jgi:hypothetical protein
MRILGCTNALIRSASHSSAARNLPAAARFYSLDTVKHLTPPGIAMRSVLHTQVHQLGRHRHVVAQACRRCPADHRRQRAGAADDDILWRAPLQAYRVHNDTEEGRKGEEYRRFDVEREREDATDAPARTRPKTSASGRDILPRAVGRLPVRVITASMSASYHMLSTPPGPAPVPMAKIATEPRNRSR